MDEAGRAGQASRLSYNEKLLRLLLYAPGHTSAFNERVAGRTWMQKQMYMVQDSVPGASFAFEPHRYGAYSPELHAMQQELVGSGIIEEADSRPHSMRLTPEGVRGSRPLWGEASGTVRDALSETKEFTNDMSFDELIADSYSTFPDMTDRSEILGDFESTRVEAACGLLSRDKVTLQKAVEISGLGHDDFLLRLDERGIPAFIADESSLEEQIA